MSLPDLESGKVYSFKTIDGNEIIAKVISADADVIMVDKPIVLVLTQQGPQMPPLMLSTTDEEFPLYRRHILTHAKTKDDAEAAYRKTTTGIDVPTRQIITG